MDLILLQPGSDALFDGDISGWAPSESLFGLDVKSLFGERPCIELVSVHQGMKQQVTTDVSNGSRTSGRPVITDFTCVKYADKTSSKFYEYCLRAEPLGKGKDQPTKIFICRSSGDKITSVMTFWLRDALISEIQFQSHPDDMATEQFKLNFTEIIWENTVQTAGSASGGKSTTGWSIMRNRPISNFS